jgi:hypothetical protein
MRDIAYGFAKKIIWYREVEEAGTDRRPARAIPLRSGLTETANDAQTKSSAPS